MFIVDFAIICALPEEYEQVVTRLTGGRECQWERWRSYFCYLENENDRRTYRVLVLQLDAKGNLASLQATERVITELRPFVVMLVGICGGIIGSVDDLQLGDVVVSDQVVYYESGKQRYGSFEFRPVKFEATSTDPNMFGCGFQRAPPDFWDASSMIAEVKPDGTGGRHRPRPHFGIVCSGEKVIASQKIAEKIRKKFPGAVSVEMEAAGVARACEGQRSSFLVVKGVSDYADCRKDDRNRAYAAATAAAFAVSLIKRSCLPPFPVRPDPTRLLSEIFRFRRCEPTHVILPGRTNERFDLSRRYEVDRSTQYANYPYTSLDCDFDDVMSALRIAPALEFVAGQNHVQYMFDRGDEIPAITHEPANLVVVGSSPSNLHTEAQMRDLGAFVHFGLKDRDLVPVKGPPFSAETRAGHGGFQAFTNDYALISGFRTDEQSIMIIGGCRAYGQLAAGDLLADAGFLERLLHRVGADDFQCVVKAEIKGKSLARFLPRMLVVRKSIDHDWREVDIDRGL